ncbi:hypothetical protein FACS189429_6060 [Bacteroidia bacterium]|nr:hypothetical protein FACS189429_6060 [Bacteroidia bacterium]
MAAFVACGPNEPPTPEPPKPLTLSATTLSLTEGGSGVVKILTGNGGYAASSSNTAVATAAVNADSTVTITAVAEGTANIIITDVKQQADTLLLTVNSLPAAGAFVFTNISGSVYPANASVNSVEENTLGQLLSPIRIKKIVDGAVIATLKISVSSDSEFTIGYCGWGFEQCVPVSVGASVSSTKTVTSDELIDPVVESLGEVRTGAARVTYELSYADKIQKVTWICSR